MDDNGLYFRVGRTTQSTIEVYENGAFADQEFETAPYTHVLMDVHLEICCIARKGRLAQTPRGIANQLTRLLNRSEAAGQRQAEFEIAPIFDPDDLINYLGRAVNVSKFWITFKRPNPFDANTDFIQPMQRLLNGAGATKGKTEIAGQDMVVESLEKLARSAASTGDDAVARLSLEPNQPTVKKSLRGNPVIIRQEDLSDMEQRQQMLQRMRDTYQRVRSGGGEDV